MIESVWSKIEKVIAALDVKKNQALQTTWVKITGPPSYGNVSPHAHTCYITDRCTATSAPSSRRCCRAAREQRGKRARGPRSQGDHQPLSCWQERFPCVPSLWFCKVAFGSVWKESLSELSGGQRSLLALSLILALLLFKPAPMYILDEVL